MCPHARYRPMDAGTWMAYPYFFQGGIYVQKAAKSNISDTQIATFEYPELNCVWTHRTWGTPNNPDYGWSFTLYGEKVHSGVVP